VDYFIYQSYAIFQKYHSDDRWNDIFEKWHSFDIAQDRKLKGLPTRKM
jgi:hypothetical protein